MRSVFFYILQGIYRVVRPFLYLFDAEYTHERAIKIGGILEKNPTIRTCMRSVFRIQHPMLWQHIHDISFENPIGLAAGYDYNAQLGHILADIGFGFETVGTITRHPYKGNPPPRLGRLPKSKSLMVYKGFKNPGIQQILEKTNMYSIPVGISIGTTNTETIRSHEDAIQDIVTAFSMAEQQKNPFAYYELNISCPNLMHAIEFYSPAHLKNLLAHVTDQKLTKPLFIKLPIDRSDEAMRDMLDVIMSFPVQGICIGNLQKNRRYPLLVQKEVAKFQKGNFSGKPCAQRSDELIRLAYTYIGKKLTIIGCGGVFSGHDAYKKIRLGASLVQLITGLIFVGPQLVTQINTDLIRLLKKDSFTHIQDAIGIDA